MDNSTTWASTDCKPLPRRRHSSAAQLQPYVYHSSCRFDFQQNVNRMTFSRWIRSLRQRTFQTAHERSIKIQKQRQQQKVNFYLRQICTTFLRTYIVTVLFLGWLDAGIWMLSSNPSRVPASFFKSSQWGQSKKKLRSQHLFLECSAFVRPRFVGKLWTFQKAAADNTKKRWALPSALRMLFCQKKALCGHSLSTNILNLNIYSNFKNRYSNMNIKIKYFKVGCVILCYVSSFAAKVAFVVVGTVRMRPF